MVVSREVATGWLERLLALDWSKVRFAAMAAATIARKTGDRARDLDAVICERVAARLDKVPSMSGLSESVRTVVALSEQDERKIFGDSLPEGLKLVSD